VTVHLDLADYLLMAEAVLGLPAELIADFNRIGLATVEFVGRNGRTWVPASLDPDETDHAIRGIAGDEMSEVAFRDWIAQRIG
jgi:hypothetical protein